MQLRPNIAKQINIPEHCIYQMEQCIYQMNTATAFTVSYKQHFENESCIAQPTDNILKRKTLKLVIIFRRLIRYRIF